MQRQLSDDSSESPERQYIQNHHSGMNSTSEPRPRLSNKEAPAHPKLSSQEIITNLEAAGKDWRKKIELTPGNIITCTFDGEWAELLHRRTEGLGSSSSPANKTISSANNERLATSPRSSEISNKKSDEETAPLPNHSMSQTQALNREKLAEPKGRFLRACHALEVSLACSSKKKFTWRNFLFCLILGFVGGMLGTAAWRCVSLGWRPWARTPEEEAMWCRSTGIESLFL